MCLSAVQIQMQDPLCIGIGEIMAVVEGVEPLRLLHDVHRIELGVEQVAKPLNNSKVALNEVELPKTYLYDLKTEAGKEYVLIGK